MGKSHTDCQNEWDDSQVKVYWGVKEDSLLTTLVEKYGLNSWKVICQKMQLEFGDSLFSASLCKDRWLKSVQQK